jgi:hypothetical protein
MDLPSIMLMDSIMALYTAFSLQKVSVSETSQSTSIASVFLHTTSSVDRISLFSASDRPLFLSRIIISASFVGRLPYLFIYS